MWGYDLVVFLFIIHISQPQVDTGPPGSNNVNVESTTTTTFPVVLNQVDNTDCTTADVTWLAWNEWSACTDECGSCGFHIRARTCLTKNTACNCTGDGTEIEYCNMNICRYPRLTCCNNLKVTSYEGRFACLASSTLVGRRISRDLPD